MTAEEVLEVLEGCAAQGLPVWVDGGWAVDAVLGRQTRPHEDLDLAARVEDGLALEALLAGLGLVRQAGGPAWNPVYRDGGGRSIDLHLFRLDAEGRGVMDPDDPAAAYPAGSFDGRGVIAGRAVDCLPAEILWRLKTGYSPRDRDLLDLAALQAAFGFTRAGD
ncbi:MAG: nucleotidyltransferase domain-containing protein [Phenylobacterium sp.]